jgi:hypothetical protein
MILGESGKISLACQDPSSPKDLQILEKNLPSQKMSTVWKGDAAEVELDVAERTP